MERFKFDDTFCNSRYKILSLFGSGGYGAVYKGKDTLLNRDVAIKVAHLSESDVLEKEIKAYQHIGSKKHFPTIYWYGQDGDYHLFVMQLLNKSLDDMLMRFGKLSLKTIFMLADQAALCFKWIFEALSFMHSAGSLHRDIKSGNMSMGLGDTSETLYIYDFDLVKQFKHNNRHTSQCYGTYTIGTYRYTSLNSPEGISKHIFNEKARQTKSIYIYEDVKLEAIYQLKENIVPEKLCVDLPLVFITFLKYVHNLSFAEKPDYNYLRNMFRSVYEQNKYQVDNLYEWTKTTDPEMITYKKKKKIETRKIRMKRTKEEKKFKKVISRPRKKWPNPVQDFLLPSNLPIKQKRAIVL
ncbi:kinase-like protein [Rhizopus microsporus ATCC 52813]|uniref:Kinase-like protein n=1 Tax=Rhizopus microsporus ATCC 52813 TaxID=1340429 RepID=A0A2G4SLH2_RHIZD|nr:kinase-like protein [Rhizopus microsporus ATCC 52813]PHZ09613.1 kinase-like protein [Rhizopus microsporus ATCC 52813]